MNPVFSQIKAQNIDSLLTKLARLNNDCFLRRGEQQAAVAVYLTQGNLLYGWPLDVDGTSHSGKVLVLKTTDSPSDFDKNADIIYIQLQNIAAVRVMNNLHLMDILTNGVTIPQFSEPEISRLPAKRQAEENKKLLNGKDLEIKWDSFPNHPFANNFILKFLTLMIDYINGLKKDSIGKEAMNSFSKIVFEYSNSDSLSARKIDKLIIVSIPYNLLEIEGTKFNEILNKCL